MAFWLAKKRRGQETDFIQRFDPRFWTVNFPRPMMASVVTTGADGLRVDCEFHHEGELAGLIWDSEDTLDHPLLAYETRRDYAHCTLQFRWRSGGVVALDAAHGPTLTIEGRDAAGSPRSWYVRLWNYAEGTPEDAVIRLPFSQLQSGFVLPGEAVHPGDIDRMFISIVPPGFTEGSAEPLAARADGWVELSDIVCDGANAVIPVGDVMVPEHGERIATAYDDSFNQTPERIMRNITGLGYRDRLVHYVGMSHFFRLRREGEGLLVDPSGALCTPAICWHEAFFAACRAADIDPVVSLSYELFAEHCPLGWQQVDRFGNYARTGWDPPSALLSPAISAAMGYVRSVATHFVALQEAAGLPVLFQIGEPWWWVIPETGAICIYDAAMSDRNREEFGVLRGIDDVRGEIRGRFTAVLDLAGEVLAESTAALSSAVREAASGDAEILLLAFTPTILDPAMPDLYRANLPTGWAWPAFDRLQLEDYDWLTAGAEALRKSAYRTVDERLGYPLDRQDYLSGFVLRAEDASRFWPLIDDALDEARQRGVTQRYVWALPQVARDGYTRLPNQEDAAMQAFDDVLYPLALGRDAGVSPEFSTSVAVTSSGHERRNSLWSDARLSFDVGPGLRSEKELGTLIAFFRARRGAARGFRLPDPFDFSSNAMTGTPTPGDQHIGDGDGLSATFRLVKSYGEAGDPQIRPITRPRAGTVRVAVDGSETADWTLGDGGTIVFAQAPAQGSRITAGFLFDVPVRFAQDRLDVTGASFAVGEAPSVPLIEIREAT
ncbi:DUF2460 domain-containing protein [Erythrobacteraceae bacterium WH01K]|nr:DUF2460 domain-containing protein [Erythrobacteraceae bacterium WH01K]